MFRFDQLIRRDMIIRDVKQRHPETIPVFEDLHYRPTCDDCDIETVARKNGLNVAGRGGGPESRPRSDQRRTPKIKQVTKPAKKELHHQRNQPLDVFFSPKTVAVIGATENPGTRRTDRAVEPGDQPVRRHGLSGEPEAAQRVWA